jgi:hypothetical protein
MFVVLLRFTERRAMAARFLQTRDDWIPSRVDDRLGRLIAQPA